MAESTSLAEGCRLGCERFKVEHGKSGILRGRAGYVADTRNLYTRENKCALAPSFQLDVESFRSFLKKLARVASVFSVRLRFKTGYESDIF